MEKIINDLVNETIVHSVKIKKAIKHCTLIQFIIGFKNKRFVNSLVDEIFIEEKTLPMNLFFNYEKTVTARFERESIPKYASRIYFVR